jgi:acetyltransferase EpsM
MGAVITSMSNAQPIVVIGGGEHARVVIEAARTRPDLWRVDGFMDPRPCEDTQQRLGVTSLGGDAVRDDVHYVLGVGEVGVGELRQRILAKYAGARFATIIDARAHVGMHAVIGTGVIVEHDVSVGNFAQLGPGAVVGGGARIEANSYVGLGARIRDHVTIGAGVMVAMGAVVTANVGAGATVLGVPARAR